MRVQKDQQAIVIGAGIVGVCTALQLQMRGVQTTIVDRQPPGTGCSYGNAGVISDSAAGTVASPGIVWRVPGFLFSKSPPLAINWSYLPALTPWLYEFIKASRRDRYVQNTEHLGRLVVASSDAYAPLLDVAGAHDLFVTSGALQVYETKEALEATTGEITQRRLQGARVERIDTKDVSAYAPTISNHIAGALYRPDVQYVTSPLELVQRLHRSFVSLGGRSEQIDVRKIEKRGQHQWAIQGVNEAGDHLALDAFQHVVVAAGGYSKGLLKPLGVSTFLDVERGYHVSLAGSQNMLSMPVFYTEGGFCMTPMKDGLRIAGTVELAGLNAPANYGRVDAMKATVKRLIPDIPTTEGAMWMGMRPSTPDSLPTMGPVSGHDGLHLAFGHGHLGLTLGAITGQLITQGICGEPSSIGLHPYRNSRFSRQES